MDVKIVDETVEEELTPEELEELERRERLKKLTRKKKSAAPWWGQVVKGFIVLGVIGILCAGLFFQSGTMMAISLAVTIAAGAVSYFFFR